MPNYSRETLGLYKFDKFIYIDKYLCALFFLEVESKELLYVYLYIPDILSILMCLIIAVELLYVY